MRHVVGLYTPKKTEQSWLLDPLDRFVFRTDSFHSLGYFSLIASAFERYAQRDAKVGINSINVKFRVSADDLDDALVILRDLETALSQRPISWREYLGEIQYPRQEKQPLRPLLFRRRAVRVIQRLRALTIKAQAEDKCLVYGNGVCYRALCGIRLAPGVVYS